MVKVFVEIKEIKLWKTRVKNGGLPTRVAFYDETCRGSRLLVAYESRGRWRLSLRPVKHAAGFHS